MRTTFYFFYHRSKFISIQGTSYELWLPSWRNQRWRFAKNSVPRHWGRWLCNVFFKEEKWHIPNMGHRYTNRMILIIPVYDVHDLDPIDERRKDTAIFLGGGRNLKNKYFKGSLPSLFSSASLLSLQFLLLFFFLLL